MGIEEDPKTFGDMTASSAPVTNGSVDFRGRIADKTMTGGWKASPFIIVNEVAERMAFYAIAVSMVTYLVKEMHQSLPDAATHVNDWVGAAFILTILGAFLADAYLGRFLTIVVFSCIYAVGMALLTVSASLDGLRPPPGQPATSKQNAILYISLSLIALGTGGIKPCVSSFGADQFDESDPKESARKSSFFNWFFFAINMGVLLGITVMVYVQEERGWGWGFGVPAAVTVVSIAVIAAGFRVYRYQKPMGSPFTRFLQVLVAACRNHLKGVVRGGELYEVKGKESDIVGARKLRHTNQYRFLDKAAVITDPNTTTTAAATKPSRWRLCTVTQVEELKCFIRVLPIWATTISLSLSFAQMSTFFISQSSLMNRTLSSFTVPPGSVPVFAALVPLLLVPLYESLAVPLLRNLTGHRRGVTSLQRMGAGLFIAIFAFLSAAAVEKHRRSSSTSGLNTKPPSVLWLLPQFLLMGAAEALTYVGQLEFFYDEATDGTRSLCSAMFLSEFGIGSWLSTALVKVVEGATGGEERGWLRSGLDESKLDLFYWVLCGVNAVSFLVYLVVATRYEGKDGGRGGSVRDESLVMKAEEEEEEGV